MKTDSGKATGAGPRICPEGKHEAMGINADMFRANTDANRMFDLATEAYVGHCSACGTTVYAAVEVVDGPPPGSRLEICGTCNGKKKLRSESLGRMVECDACEARGVQLFPVPDAGAAS